jgi:hypothetical protein
MRSLKREQHPADRVAGDAGGDQDAGGREREERERDQDRPGKRGAGQAEALRAVHVPRRPLEHEVGDQERGRAGEDRPGEPA